MKSPQGSFRGTVDITTLYEPASPPKSARKKARSSCGAGGAGGKGILSFFTRVDKPDPNALPPPPPPPPSLSELQKRLPAGASVFSDRQDAPHQPTIAELHEATMRMGNLTQCFDLYNPEGDGHCMVRYVPS
jgi:hypothetical protein